MRRPPKPEIAGSNPAGCAKRLYCVFKIKSLLTLKIQERIAGVTNSYFGDFWGVHPEDSL